jgi:TolA-binding protein
MPLGDHPMIRVETPAGTPWAAIGLCAIAAGAFGCGGQTDAQERHVAELTQEVTRLTTDNAVLQNRIDAIDTRIRRLKQSPAGAGASASATPATRDRPELSVIKLTPGGTAQAAMGTVAPSPSPPAEAEGAPRPILKSTPQGEIVEEVAPAEAGPTSSASADYEAAMRLVKTKSFVGAIPALAEFLARYPEDERVTEVRYWRGHCYQALGKYRQAVDQFALVAGTRDARVADALFGLYMSHASLGEGKSAIIAKERLLQEFPQAEAAKRIR